MHTGDTKFLNQWGEKRGTYRQAHQRTGTGTENIFDLLDVAFDQVTAILLLQK